MSLKPEDIKYEGAAHFQDASVVARYHHRLPYPAEVFEILLSLIIDQPRVVLDVGTGTGEIARPLAAQVERVDAVDISAPMIEKGRQTPGGDQPHLNWLHGRVEDAPLSPPYALIVGGDSIHWMDQQVIFTRFHEMLTSNGVVVLLTRRELPAPWQEDLSPLIARFSLMQNYQPYDLIEEVEKPGLFQLVGDQRTVPVSSKQSVEDYIASAHSRSTFSIERMPPENVIEFDNRLRELITPYSEDGLLTLQTVAHLQWLRPVAPSG